MFMVMKDKETKKERLERLRMSKTMRTQVIKDKTAYDRKKIKSDDNKGRL